MTGLITPPPGTEIVAEDGQPPRVQQTPRGLSVTITPRGVLTDQPGEPTGADVGTTALAPAEAAAQTPLPGQPVEGMDVGTTALAPAEAAAQTPLPGQPVEGMDVAGGTIEMLRALQRRTPRTDPPLLPSGQATGVVADYVVARPATASEMAEWDRLTAAGIGETTGKPPALQFNLDRITSSDDVKATIDRVNEFAGITTDRVTFDQIRAVAQSQGIDEAFLGRIATRERGGDMFNAVDTFKALNALVASAGELDRLAGVAAAATSGPMDLLRFQQQLTFHTLLQKQIKGIQTDTARALASMRIPRDGAMAADAVRQVMENGGGENSIRAAAEMYLTLDTRAARNGFAEQSFFARAYNAWEFAYINGLLSHPRTHIINLFGSSGFTIYMQTVEKGAAAAIGSLRVRLPGATQEQIKAKELVAGLTGLIQGVQDGLVLAGRAFVENAPQADIVSKLEMRRRTATPPISAAAFNASGRFGQALDYLGVAIGAPGRLILTADEFVKAVAFRMELHAQASRRYDAIFDGFLNAGNTADQARALTNQRIADFLLAPPEDVVQSASDFARVATFQSTLQSELLQNTEKLVSNPLLKMHVPFFRTPTNIMLQAFERTPLAPFSARWRADFSAGGIRRDIALARVTVGSMVSMAAVDWATQGLITGKGPDTIEERQALQRAGWQPYSLVIRRGAMSDAALEQLKDLTGISIGPDYVYLPLRGFDPLSPLLAMAADYAETIRRNPDDNGNVEVMAAAIGFGMMNYMAEQPWAAGVGRIADVFRSSFSESGEKLEDIAGKVVRLYAQPIATGFVPFSSLLGQIEGVIDPVLSNPMPNEMDLSLVQRGFYTAMNAVQGRIPGASKGMPPALDIFGRERSTVADSWWEFFSPIRLSEGKMSPADAVLIELGLPIKMPPKRMDGVYLTADMYNRLLVLSGSEITNGAGQNVQDAIVAFAKEPAFQLLPLGSRQDAIAKVYSGYLALAREMLKVEFPDLKLAIEQEKLAREQYGR